MCVTGNKNGNRRTANIRSVGYSDLFVLSKEDLWEALQEYPEARLRLLEKGRQMLRKDNLLDEEVASRQELDQLSTEEKLTRLERSLEETFERLTTLTDRFNSVQQQFKQRITRAEKEQCISRAEKEQRITRAKYSSASPGPRRSCAESMRR